MLKSLEDNVVYFISPSDIKELGEIDYNKNMGIGGMVKKILFYELRSINFIITDLKMKLV